MTKVWGQLFRIQFHPKTSFRQENKEDFERLCRIRSGAVTGNDRIFLCSLVKSFDYDKYYEQLQEHLQKNPMKDVLETGSPNDAAHLSQSSDEHSQSLDFPSAPEYPPIRLVSTNPERTKHNVECLAKLQRMNAQHVITFPAAVHEFCSIIRTPIETQYKPIMNKATKQKTETLFKTNFAARNELAKYSEICRVTYGSPVLITRNIRSRSGTQIYNGYTGTVVGTMHNKKTQVLSGLKVKLDHNGAVVNIRPMEIIIPLTKTQCISVKEYMPLQLMSAGTVHMHQGRTLKRVEYVCEPNPRCGNAFYTAYSRVKVPSTDLMLINYSYTTPHQVDFFASWFESKSISDPTITLM
jgi:hypothetical protein